MRWLPVLRSAKILNQIQIHGRMVLDFGGQLHIVIAKS